MGLRERCRRAASILCPVLAAVMLAKAPPSKCLVLLHRSPSAAVFQVAAGYVNPRTFGSRSYFIERPRLGNVLVDSPLLKPELTAELGRRGGVRYHFLTHRDEVDGHADIHRLFGTTRILHKGDISASTQDVEVSPAGDDLFVVDEELTVVPTPGHTQGHTCLLFASEFLFTGDHVGGSPGGTSLRAYPYKCWHSWPLQLRSLARLRQVPFRWVLPAHGEVLQAPSVDAMHDLLARLCASLESPPPHSAI